MAIRAGIPMQDQEFVQFHPTGKCFDFNAGVCVCF
jgi:aspartate oxidase